MRKILELPSRLQH